MSKTKNYLMEQEEEFYTIAESKISECEHIDEFRTAMEPFSSMVSWNFDPQSAAWEWEDLISEMWSEYWSKYAA